MRKSPLQKALLHLANLVVICFILLPMAAVVIGSLLAEKNLAGDTRSIIPGDITFDNFRVIISRGEQRGQVISMSVTLLTLVFASLSAYTIVKLGLRWVAWLLAVNVFARFVPIIVLMIPLYVVFRQMGLLNSMWGVIIALTGFLLPYGILILVPYFASIPRELDEAARIDGCTRFTAFLRITLPLSTPALASYGAIVFIIAWNDLLIPLILNNRAEFMTLPVVIASLVGDVFVVFNLMMAICLIALTPSVILVLLLRKFVVAGLTAGGVKG
jgi:multiple sugar transport system permease protein